MFCLTGRRLFADLADNSGDLVVQAAEVLLVGLKEVQEVSGGIGGDTVDVLGVFSDKFSGHGLDGIEGVSDSANGLGEDSGDGVPGVGSGIGDGTKQVTEDSTASDLADERVDSVVEEVGQVERGNQFLSVGDGLVDQTVDDIGDVVEESEEFA